MNPTIVTLTGPTCSGKSTLERMLVERGFSRVISTTTRAPRAGEKDGEAYYFVTPSQFELMNDRLDFIECVNFNGHHYSVTKSECERAFSQGKPVVLVVEPEGKRQIELSAKQLGWRLFSVFVNIDPQDQLNRFIARTERDMLAATGCPTEFTRNLLRRLYTMNNDERLWGAKVMTRPDYSLFLDSFGQDNDKRMVNVISNVVTGLMQPV